MSAPTPIQGPIPTLFTGSYLKRQFGAGNLYVGAPQSPITSGTTPGYGGTIFDDLVNPPANGVTAETQSLTNAQAIGRALITWNTAATAPVSSSSQTNGHTYNTPLIVANMVKKNFDWVMNFYLENSIARSGGVPII